jgi:lysozyme
MATIPTEVLDLVKRSEGLRLKAYKCPAGIWTIGYGHTHGVKEGDVWTKAKADAVLKEDLQYHVDSVAKLLKVPASDLQVGAMASLAFNIGNAQFKNSSVLRLHNQRKFDAAGRAFNMWVKATVNGKKVELPGLVTRRAEEAALYLRGSVLQAASLAEVPDIAPVAQHVEPEDKPSRGATVTASTITGAAATVAGVNQLMGAANDLATNAKDSWAIAKDLGIAALLVIVIGLAGYLIYQRYKTRQEGWL